MDNLTLKNVGPIKEADITFGDLTVLVGPQATGKSVFLEFLKLMADRHSVFILMQEQGLDWRGHWDEFLKLYLGEGMSGIWKSGSELHWQGRAVDISAFVRRRTRKPG